MEKGHCAAAGLDAPVLSFRERTAVWGDRETYHVLLQDVRAVEWAQTPVGYGLHACVGDLADDQFPEAIAIYCSHDGRFDDVSEAVAHRVFESLLKSDCIGRTPLSRLIALHVPNATAILEEYLSSNCSRASGLLR